jgi:hypothetical protein
MTVERMAQQPVLTVILQWQQQQQQQYMAHTSRVLSVSLAV